MSYASRPLSSSQLGAGGADAKAKHRIHRLSRGSSPNPDTGSSLQLDSR